MYVGVDKAGDDRLPSKGDSFRPLAVVNEIELGGPPDVMKIKLLAAAISPAAVVFDAFTVDQD